MNNAKTVTGKTFYYDGDLSQGLTVRTTDKNGKIKDGGFFISPETIGIIKKSIVNHNEIPMGACRDNPAPRQRSR